MVDNKFDIFNTLSAEHEWEDPTTDSGLLFSKCPVCHKYVYHRDKTKTAHAKFLYEIGYYDREIVMQCSCGQQVRYMG